VASIQQRLAGYERKQLYRENVGPKPPSIEQDFSEN
jgi:hypothetical protein